LLQNCAYNTTCGGVCDLLISIVWDISHDFRFRWRNCVHFKWNNAFKIISFSCIRVHVSSLFSTTVC